MSRAATFLLAIFKPRPFRPGSAELLLCRIFIAWVIWDGFFFGINQASQSVPVGLAHFADLSFLQNWDLSLLLRRIWLAAGVLFVLGILPSVATGYMLALMVAWGSLRNSYGNIHHGTQIIAVVILGYFCGYAWRALVPQDASRPFWQRLLWADRRAHATAWWWAFQAAVATYIIAGLSKLEISGISWLTDLPNMSLHVEKLGWQHYMGTGEEGLLTKAQGYAGMVAGHPWLTRILVGSGLFWELFAIIALFGRWHAAIFGIALYVMHLIVIEMMQLEFPLNSWVLLIFFVNLPFLIMWLIGKTGLYQDQREPESESPPAPAKGRPWLQGWLWVPAMFPILVASSMVIDLLIWSPDLGRLVHQEQFNPQLSAYIAIDVVVFFLAVIWAGLFFSRRPGVRSTLNRLAVSIAVLCLVRMALSYGLIGKVDDDLIRHSVIATVLAGVSIQVLKRFELGQESEGSDERLV